MTVNEAYKKGFGLLKDAGNEAPANDAGALLCYVAGYDRVFIYAHGSDTIEEGLLGRYLDVLERRAAGEPLQYITGRQEFMSLTFEVKPGVLIPRHETELLVETVIMLGRSWGYSPRILDIGTGSGCIAVSLAHYIQGSRITAVDKMPEALETAEKNAVLNGVGDRIDFIRSDLFSEITGRRFDVVVSNPPYIRTYDIEKLQREVRCHEPMAALDGGIDGLDFYREIIGHSPEFLEKGKGILALETGYDQSAEVAGLMWSMFDDISVYKDLAGIGRVVTGRSI